MNDRRNKQKSHNLSVAEQDKNLAVFSNKNKEENVEGTMSPQNQLGLRFF